MAENVEQELGRARSLIQAKRYEDARALLITIDHPKADKWLSRLNEMTSATTPQYIAAPESFTVKLIITIVLLFVFIVPGLIALSIFGKEAKAAQARTKQPIPGAKELIALNRYIFILIVILLVIFLVLVVLFVVGLMNNPETAPFVYPLF